MLSTPMGFGRGRGAKKSTSNGPSAIGASNSLFNGNNSNNTKPFSGGNSWDSQPNDYNSSSNNYNSSSNYNSNNNYNSRSDNNYSSSTGCRKCGEEGHFARECPQAGSNNNDDGCRICKEPGHFARECPNKQEEKCFRCQQTGHRIADCPNPAVEGGRPGAVDYVPDFDGREEVLFAKTMQTGINFDKYDRIPVKMTGNHENEVQSITNFDALKLGDQLKRNIARSGYKTPTPVQKYALPTIVAGIDVMACAQTGSGKTAAFVIPMIQVISNSPTQNSQFASIQCPEAMVITPTRELAKQIHQETYKFAFSTVVRPAVAYGGAQVFAQRKAIRNGCNILIGTPGRLKMFVNDGTVSLKNIKFLVLDEADRMLDMGFREDIEFFAQQNEMPPKDERQTLMFSATFPNEVQEIARQFLRNDYMFIAVGVVGAAQTDVTQTFVEISRREKNSRLKEILRENEGPNSKFLIFVATKKQADFLATQLSQEDFGATSIHGDRQQREREQALKDFSTGSHPILVATAVAARGLDIPGISHVINYDLPDEIDQYTHQIGRTGRAGNTGVSISFFDPEKDSNIARSLVKLLSEAQQDVPSFVEDIANGMGAAGSGGWNNSSNNGWGGSDTRYNGGGGGGGGGGFDTGGWNVNNGPAEEELW